MRTSRIATALAVLPMVAAGLVLIPVVGWNQTVTVGTTPDPTIYSLAAYAADSTEAPSKEPPVGGALAPDGTPAPAPSDPVATAVDSPKIPTEDFRVAGVTWDRDSVDGEVVTYVRTREESGWTAWYRLDDATDDGPDPGTREAKNARAGTAPLLVGDSDAVQVKLATPDGGVPDDVQVDLLDLGKTTTTKRAEPLAAADAAAPMPTIRRRSAWGADEKIREKGAPDYGKVQGAVVHHTAGSNSYKKAEVPAVIRAIYAYHVKALKWRDIGYNVVVDKWGRAWEGRYGGLARNVVGAHALNNNGTTFGISVLGNFESAKASSAVVETLAKVIAWKFSLNHVTPGGTRRFTTNLGKKVTKPKIVGHRDVGQTACPGRNLYSKMGKIRTRVGAIMKNAGIKPTLSASASPLSYTVGGNRTDVKITVTAAGRVPTGSVQVLDTGLGEVLGESTLDSAGKASIKLPKLMRAGKRTLAILYSGDVAVAWAQGAGFTMNVTAARSSTSASYTKRAVVSGNLVKATVNVAGVNVRPRGTVSVWSGSTLLGRAKVKKTDAYAAGGTVSLRRDLAGGTHKLVARYDGHYAIAGSAAAATSLSVTKAQPRLSHARVGIPRWRARPVVRVRAKAAGQTPTGKVVVREKGKVVGKKKLSGGVADVRLTQNLTKRRYLTISYQGSASLKTAKATRTVKVAKAKMKVKRSLSKRKVKRGKKVYLRVRASAPGFQRITGRVNVYRGGTRLRSRALTRKLDGKVKIKIPTSRRGVQRLRVTISPRGYVRPYQSKVIKLKVK